MSDSPTPDEAAAALADAEAGRASLAGHIAVPRLFFASIGAAVACQIGTTAAGIAATDTSSSTWLIVTGLVVFLVVSVVQLARFRSANGVWLGGLLGRAVGGTATQASVAYAAALAAAVWAALEGGWWLVVVCAAGGGAAYALSGAGWMRRYQSAPADHSRGESAAWLTVLAVLALTGLVLLVSAR